MIASALLYWISPVFVCVSAYQEIITAKSGQNVTLSCRAPNNDSIIVIEWSRTDLAEDYVLLYRDEQFDPEYQHPSFKNRVDLQDREMKDGDVALVLKKVMTADAGTYECRVVQGGTHREKRATLNTKPINIVYLSVVPPGQPGGHRVNGVKEGGSDGLIVGLLVCLLVAAAVVGFVIYRKYKNQQSQEPYQPPDNQHHV